MYRHDQPARRPPPPTFVPMMMPRQPPPFRNTGPCSGPPPPVHLPPNPDSHRPFLASGSHYLDSRPPRGNYMNPHCSNFSIDRSTVIALGGSQQIVPPPETPHLQVPQWNPSSVDHHKPVNSDQAGEEFLRCIAANKPLPGYLKGNMAYNLADALKSANDLKESVKLNSQFSKHVPRSKSRSRSRGRSRAKSRARSKSRGRSKSRDRSRSRGRSKSRVRAKSRAKSTTRARSKSRSKKSHKRSKSRVRRSRSQSSSSERSYGNEKKRKRSPDISSNSSVGSSNNVTGNSLLEGLKLVIQSKDLEDRLPSLKNALLNIQSSHEIKKVEHVPEMHVSQHESLTNSPSLENDSMLLPHERVVSDFSWLQEKSQEEISILKAREFEEEESFLYGTETSSLLGDRAKLLVDTKQPHQMALSTFASANLDKMECEKIKNILNSLSETSDKGKMMVQTRRQNEGREAFPAVLTSDTAMATLNNPNVQKALESLQSMIKVPKEKRIRSDGQSETSPEKKKAGDGEDKKSSIKVKIKQMESLAKELEGILKQNGMGFISSVMGFYCQKCEEFIGDFISAEKHAEIHSKSKQKLDKHPKDKEGSSHHHSHTSGHRSHSSERRDHSGCSHRKDSRGSRNGRDLQNTRDETDHEDGRAGQQNIILKEELKKERMLITVNRGMTPPPLTIKTKEEKKELPIIGHAKIKTEDNRNKSSRNSRDDDQSDSSYSSGDDKSSELKHSKKKKKKKDKKKKKKERKE